MRKILSKNRVKTLFFLGYCSCLNFVLINCTEQKTIKYLDFKPTFIKAIDLDSNLTSISNFYQPYKSEKVYFFDESNLKIYEFNADLLSFNLICNIKETLPFIDGFTVDQQNKEILLFNDSAIFSFDFNGVHKKNYLLPPYNDKGFFTFLNTNFRPLKIDNEIYFHFFPNIEETYQSPIFFEQPIEAKINLNNNKVGFINSYYPSDYLISCFGYNFAPDRIQINDEKFAYSFPYNDTLFIVNLKTNEKEKQYFGSRREVFFNSVPYEQINQLNSTVFEDLFLINSNYAFSNHAPLSGYLTRQIMVSLPGIKNLSDKKNCLILYDTNYNYIGESDFNFKPGIIIDSKAGLLQLKKEQNKLVVQKLKWS